MKREPIYYFKTLDETGISEVPADSLVIVENGDNGEDLEIYILDTDPNHIKTLTLRKYLQNNSHLYKMGGFATKENAKKIEINRKNIASNLVKIVKLDDRVTVNENDIQNNERDILKNENAIGYNRVQIDRNTKDLVLVEKRVTQNELDIGHNHTHIEHNEDRIVVLEKSHKILSKTSPEKGVVLDLDDFTTENEYNFSVLYTPSVPDPLLNVPAGFTSANFRFKIISYNGMVTQQIFDTAASYIWIRSRIKRKGQLSFLPWEKLEPAKTEPELVEVMNKDARFPMSVPPTLAQIAKIKDAFRNNRGNDEFIIGQYSEHRQHPADINFTKTTLQIVKVAVVNNALFYQTYKS